MLQHVGALHGLHVCALRSPPLREIMKKSEASVLDPVSLKPRLEAIRASRNRDVLGLLRQAGGDAPHVVELQAEGDNKSKSRPVYLTDLLLSTGPGRFHIDSLAETGLIVIPMNPAYHSLSVVAGLLQNQVPSCPASAIASAVVGLNFLGAEQLLNGTTQLRSVVSTYMNLRSGEH